MNVKFLKEENYEREVRKFKYFLNYFSIRFLEYHGVEYHHIGVEEEGVIKLIIPGRIEGGRFISLKGASFGGILFERWNYNAGIRYMEGIVKFLKREGIKEIEITLPPPLPYYRDQGVEFILWKTGFEVKSIDMGVYVDLMDFKIDSHHLRNIKKAKKILVDEATVEEVYPLIEMTWSRFNQKPTHSLHDLLYLKDNFSEFIRVYGGYFEGETIGGLVLFRMNEKVYLSFYPVQNERGKKLNVMYGIMERCLEDLKKEGVRILDLGTVTGDEVNDNLLKFKVRWGGETYVRKRYALNL